MTQEEIQEEIEGFEYYNSEEDDSYVGMSEPNKMEGTRYLCHYMIDYAEYSIEHYDDGGVSGNYTYTQYHNWESKEKVNALLDTKWHQGDPFNAFCPVKHKYWTWIFGPSRRAPAGCVPVALAQIMAYHEYPQSISYFGVNIDWKEVKKIGHWDWRRRDQNNNNSQMAAALLRGIGNGSNVIYGYSSTFGLPNLAKGYLKMKGYRNVQIHLGANESKTLEMLRNSKPVFISGVAGLVGGHAWVIDGFRTNERLIELKNSTNGIVQSSYKETRTLLHCNFGWEGRSDGYYASGIFNTKYEPVDYDNKDNQSTSSNKSHYKWLFSIITYDVNK